jgi:hypothetical protein
MRSSGRRPVVAASISAARNRVGAGLVRLRGAQDDMAADVYRRLRLPDSETRILLQKTSDEKTSKERMHLDLETDDVEAEVKRLEALGATRWDHQQERGFDFWVMRDPWSNEFCVLQTEFPELLAQRQPWNDEPTTGQSK